MAKEKVFTPAQQAIYKLVMLVHQVGTAAPTVLILQNTFKNLGAITATREDVGQYTIHTENDIFTGNRPFTASIDNKEETEIKSIKGSGNNALVILNYNPESDTTVDGMSAQTSVTVELYNQINQNQ